MAKLKENKSKGKSTTTAKNKPKSSGKSFKAKHKSGKDGKMNPKKKQFIKKIKTTDTASESVVQETKSSSNAANKKPFKKKEDMSKKRKFDPNHKPSAKERRDEKKQKKDRPEEQIELMNIYETLRRKTTTAEERHNLIDKVFTTIAGKEKEIIYKHDCVRVLEMSVKYGTEEQRLHIFKLFKEFDIADIMTSKYARFLVLKLMTHGSREQKDSIIKSFHGKVKKLIKHQDACRILDEVYDKFANAAQKTSLVEEFYGPEYAVFKVASGRSIEEIFSDDPAKKDSVMKYMKESFVSLCQKEVVIHSIIHRALNDFFKYANDAQKKELIEILKDAVVHILHTRDGSKVAMSCLWNGTAKDRKTIIKSFKTYIVKICKEEFGHQVLLALFDVIDDTVLLKKAIFPEIISNLKELIMDQYGRKVLLYLLSPRSNQHFIPEQKSILQQGDGNVTSKKDSSIRQQELRDAIINPVFDAMKNSIQEILKNKSACMVLLASLEHSTGNASGQVILENICTLAAVKFEDDDDQGHIADDECGHWVLKKVIEQDKSRVKKDDSVLLSRLLCESIPDGYFAEWCNTNRRAFVLASLLETNIDEVVSRIKEDLKDISKSVTDTPSKGLTVVLSKLAAT